MADRQFIDFRNDSLLDSLKKSETNFTSLFSLAKTVKLTANKTVVTYLNQEGTTEGDTILLTITPRGFDLENTQYQFVVGENYTSGFLNAEETTVWELPDYLEPANEQSIVVTVNVYENGTEEVDAFDSVTITGIQGLFEGVVGADGADGADAQVVKLTANQYVIRYSESGSEGDSITFTAETQGFTGSPYYKFTKVDTGEVLQNTTDNELILDDEDEPQLGEVITVKVDVSETEDGTILATDSVSIYAVQDGSDAIIAFLTNASHVVPASSNGTIELGVIDGSNNITGAGGTFKVFVGATEVTTGNGCVFTESTDALDIASIDPDTGVYTISSDNFNENYSFIEFEVEIPASVAKTQSNVTIEAVYTISKSNAGVNGLNGQDAVNAVLDLTNDRHSVAADNGGTVTDDYSTAFTYVDFYLNGSEIFRSASWDYSLKTISGYDDNIIEATIGDEGETWIMGFLKTNTDGGWNEPVSTPINRFDVSSLTADTGTITFQAIRDPDGDNESFIKVMTLTKIKAGADGADAVIYSLFTNTNSVLRLENDTYTPDEVSFTAKRRIGNGDYENAPTLNTDIIILIKDKDGQILKTITRNNQNTASTGDLDTITLDSGDRNSMVLVEATLKISNTTVDVETVPILNDGTPGAGLVYRGTYDTNAIYYHTNTRRDVVQYTSGGDTSYYITNNEDSNGNTGFLWDIPTGSNWTTFSDTFDSVATDLLLANDVGIINTLVMGTLDPNLDPASAVYSDDNGIIRHAGAVYQVDGSPNDYYFGRGFFLNSNGDFYLGGSNTANTNSGTGTYFLFDTSENNLTLKGDDLVLDIGSANDGSSLSNIKIRKSGFEINTETSGINGKFVTETGTPFLRIINDPSNKRIELSPNTFKMYDNTTLTSSLLSLRASNLNSVGEGNILLAFDTENDPTDFTGMFLQSTIVGSPSFKNFTFFHSNGFWLGRKDISDNDPVYHYVVLDSSNGTGPYQEFKNNNDSTKTLKIGTDGTNGGYIVVNGTSGLNETKTWNDGTNSHTVVIKAGIITSWNIT